MILIDLSQIVWMNTYKFFGKDGGKIELVDDTNSMDILRTAMLSSILFYKTKFKEYGKVVICCDSNDGYWRLSVSKYYKAARKEKREASVVDSKLVAKFIDSFKQELIDNFTFPVIEVSKSEGDDVIAVISKWAQSNDLTESLFDSEAKPIMIISADQDFLQLGLLNKNIKQYCPRKGELIKADKPLDQYLIQHTIAGDSVDCICNVISPENSLFDHIKQKSITKKILESFYEKGIDACENDFQRENYIRNQKLVDFNFIPKEISDRIIEAYISYQVNGSLQKIMNYLIKHKCGKKLISSYGDFVI